MTCKILPITRDIAFWSRKTFFQKTSETRRERERVHGERELAKLKTDLDEATTEKETIEKEFNTYKARVHTVLKQQKSQKTDPNQLEQVFYPLSLQKYFT